MSGLLSRLRGWLGALTRGAGEEECKGREGVEARGRTGGAREELCGEGREDLDPFGADLDPFDPFPEPVRLDVGDVFDLHAFAPRDVRAVVEEYLLEARRKGFRSVRIVHGKGAGVQREIVRTVLARTPFVESFTDAPPEAGGWGATVARLRPRDAGE